MNTIYNIICISSVSLSFYVFKQTRTAPFILETLARNSYVVPQMRRVSQGRRWCNLFLVGERTFTSTTLINYCDFSNHSIYKFVSFVEWLLCSFVFYNNHSVWLQPHPTLERERKMTLRFCCTLSRLCFLRWPTVFFTHGKDKNHSLAVRHIKG